MKFLMAICVVVALVAGFAPAHAAELTLSKPEDAGMSASRLALIGKRLSAEAAENKLPGAVVAVARHGRLVYFEAVGWRDNSRATRMTPDTVFNVASMSKPVTTVGGLILFEQGRLLLADPVGKYLPQLANKQVAVLD